MPRKPREAVADDVLLVEEVDDDDEDAAGSRWAADGKIRLCGTPGCQFRDFHPGPCSNAIQSGAKRERVATKPTLVDWRPTWPQKAATKAKRKGKGGAGAGEKGGAGGERGGKRQKGSVAAAAAGPKEPKERPVPRRSTLADELQCDPRPAQQFALPSGLSRFYHVHTWGEPLPDGPVDADGSRSDDEADQEWMLDERAKRMRARVADGAISSAEAEFMELWNAHLVALRMSPQPLVSDRMLPGACREFARSGGPRNAAALLRPSARLHAPFRAHLKVLWEHNLLHRDDVQDCLLLVGSGGGGLELDLCAQCSRPQHEPHCALAQRTRGAASWPVNHAGTTDKVELAEQGVREGGLWHER